MAVEYGVMPDVEVAGRRVRLNCGLTGDMVLGLKRYAATVQLSDHGDGLGGLLDEEAP